MVDADLHRNRPGSREPGSAVAADRRDGRGPSVIVAAVQGLVPLLGTLREMLQLVLEAAGDEFAGSGEYRTDPPRRGADRSAEQHAPKIRTMLLRLPGEVESATIDGVLPASRQGVARAPARMAGPPGGPGYGASRFVPPLILVRLVAADCRSPLNSAARAWRPISLDAVPDRLLALPHAPRRLAQFGVHRIRPPPAAAGRLLRRLRRPCPVSFRPRPAVSARANTFSGRPGLRARRRAPPPWPARR